MKMFYAIHGNECRVVGTRSERDEVIARAGGIWRAFFQRDNALYFADHGVTQHENRRNRSADRLLESGEHAIVAYTDGACSRSRRGIFAGAGVWFGHDSPHNVSQIVGPHDGKPPTNQRAELVAIREALFVARDLEKSVLVVYTDSRYCIRLLFNMRTHAYKCFLDKRGVDMANGDVLESIWLTTEEKNIGIVVYHVYGHSGNEGNEAADRLAVEARELAERLAGDLN